MNWQGQGETAGILESCVHSNWKPHFSSPCLYFHCCLNLTLLKCTYFIIKAIFYNLILCYIYLYKQNIIYGIGIQCIYNIPHKLFLKVLIT